MFANILELPEFHRILLILDLSLLLFLLGFLVGLSRRR